MTAAAMRTLVVVPTHNEAANIVALLTRLRHSVPDVDIVVTDDDLASDIADELRAAGPRVVMA